MRVGILFNTADTLPIGRENEAPSVNEGVEIAGKIENILMDRYEVIPIKTTLDIGQRVKNGRLDIVFNVCEGFEGDSKGEAWVAAQLEMARVPFTGSGSMTLALCQNKATTKQILISKGIFTPMYQVLHSTSQRLEEGLKWPLIVKPLSEDASEGISQASVVKNKLELNRMVGIITDTYDQPALVEEYIEGRELNIAIIGNWPCLDVLPISEIMFEYPPGSHKIVDYDSKWIEGSENYKGSYGVCPAKLSKEEYRKVAEASKAAFRVLGCRDYARVDIRLREGVPYILEVNPNPGINTDSGFCRSAGKAGMTYADLINRILKLSIKRAKVEKMNREIPEALKSSSRIQLRYVSPKDMNILLDWFNDPETAEMMEDPNSRYSREELYDKFFLSGRGEVDLISCDAISGDPFGFISIYNIKGEAGTGEISFLIGDKKMKGKGLGKEMIELAIRSAFEELKMNRLEAVVVSSNKKSLKVLRSAGFKEAGTFHQKFFDGKDLKDEIVLEIINNDQDLIDLNSPVLW